MKLKLYLDADDVIFDTASHLCLKVGSDNITDLYSRVDWSSNLVNEVFTNYSEIPLKPESRSTVSLLNHFYHVIILSEYNSLDEKLSKTSELKSWFSGDIRMINRKAQRKWTLDLSDGILVDDNPEILIKCNAKKKVLFENDVYLNDNRRYKGIKVRTWFELLVELCGPRKVRYL